MRALKAPKVYWNPEEEWNFLYIYSSLVMDHPNMGIGERIVKAMHVAVELGKLAPDRVRPFHNTSFLDPYREKLETMREKVLRDRHEQAVKAEAEAAAKALQNPDPAVEATIQQVLVLLNDKRIQQRLRDILVARPIYETVGQPAAKHDPKMPEEPNKSKPKKKVLIVGLIGTQMDTIKRAFSHKFDLKFVDKNGSRDLIRENASTADISICMSRWVNHDVSAIMKTKAEKNGHKFTMCPGHLQDLQRILAVTEP